MSFEFIDKAIEKHGSRSVLIALVGMLLISQIPSPDASMLWWQQFVLVLAYAGPIAAVAIYGIYCRYKLDSEVKTRKDE